MTPASTNFRRAKQGKISLNPAFVSLLAANNIALDYDTNPRLTQQHNANFAPRVGSALTMDPKTVLRGGYGMFYQGQQAMGAAYNLGFKYPFLFTNSFPSPCCTVGSASCANNGYTLEKGFRRRFGTGVTTFFSVPTLVGQSIDMKTTYAMSYNLTMEHALSSDMVASFVVSPDDGHLVANQFSNAVSVFQRDRGTLCFK